MKETIDRGAWEYAKAQYVQIEELRADLRLKAALDRLVQEVKPISLEQAAAREAIWTPEQESTEPAKTLWTPGGKEPA